MKIQKNSILQKVFLCLLMFNMTGYADEIVVVVNKNNSENHLDKNDIEQIFLDKAEFFPNGTNALPVNYSYMSKNNALRAKFEKELLGKSQNQIRAYWSRLVFTGTGKLPREVLSSGDVGDLIANVPGTIAYINKSEVNNSMKIIYP